MLTFLSLQDLALGTQGTASLVSAFDRSVALLKPSAIQRMQYDLQRQWLQDDEVPAIELILFSNSLGAPAANHSSIAILGAGMVRPKGASIASHIVDKIPIASSGTRLRGRSCPHPRFE